MQGKLKEINRPNVEISGDKRRRAQGKKRGQNGRQGNMPGIFSAACGVQMP